MPELRRASSPCTLIIFSLALIVGLGTAAFGAVPVLVQEASAISSSATALPVAAASPVTAGNIIF